MKMGIAAVIGLASASALVLTACGSGDGDSQLVSLTGDASAVISGMDAIFFSAAECTDSPVGGNPTFTITDSDDTEVASGRLSAPSYDGSVCAWEWSADVPEEGDYSIQFAGGKSWPLSTDDPDVPKSFIIN